MDIAPDSLPWQTVYKVLIGSILPRPIGWISSIDAQGQFNLAPFSFFNAVCANPPHLLFCPMVRANGFIKDTLRNVRETGEFVVNIVTAELAESMNQTSADLPPEVDEFSVANLITLPSTVVRPPRVAASPIHFECKVADILDYGDQPGAGSVVVGRVVYLHVRPEVLYEGDKIKLEALNPIGRLGGNRYSRATDTFEMIRPVSQLKPGAG